LVWLDNPDKFLNWVVEVELDLVGGRPDGFIAGELNLFDEVFMRVLGHTSAFIGVKENVINVEGGRYEGLVVSSVYLLGGCAIVKSGYCP